MNAVYMMASRKHGTLYIGVTSELLRRVHQHREGLRGGFTAKYGVKRLVWFEPHDSIVTAIQRETSLKRYPRQWKINLIERDNPHWHASFSGCSLRTGRYLTSSPLNHRCETVAPVQRAPLIACATLARVAPARRAA